MNLAFSIRDIKNKHQNKFKKYAYLAYQISTLMAFISYQNAFKLFALFKQVFTTIQN